MSSHTRFCRSGITQSDRVLRLPTQCDSGKLFFDSPLAPRRPFSLPIPVVARHSKPCTTVDQTRGCETWPAPHATNVLPQRVVTGSQLHLPTRCRTAVGDRPPCLRGMYHCSRGLPTRAAVAARSEPVRAGQG